MADAIKTDPVGVDDPVALIEDNIVRRLVRVAVHVKAYAPYYGATAAFGLMLLFVPALGGKAEAPAPFATGQTVTGGATTPSAGTGAASGLGGSELAYDASPDDFFETTLDTEYASPSGAAYDFDTTEYPSGDSSDSGSGQSEATEEEAPCTLPVPSPAPQVTPAREVENTQGTLEAATGAAAPADGGATVASVAETAGCGSTGASSAPSAPLAPVATVEEKTAITRLIRDMSLI